MSVPASPAPWQQTARTLARATSLSFWSGIIVWRWLVLLPVFAVTVTISQDILRYSFKEDHLSRPVDVWDLFPAMVSHYYMVLLLFGCGFMGLVGDSFRAEQEQGVVAMTMVRMPSRTLYWLGKLGALGLMALAFIALALLVVFVVGMVIAPPPSAWPMLPREGVKGMFPEVRMPVPVYVFLLAGYTAWTLWIAGSLVVLASLFIRHRLGALGVIALWLVVSLSRLVDTRPGSLAKIWCADYLGLLDLSFLIGFFKHRGDAPMSLSGFFAVTSALLALIAAVGARRLRREEL